MADYRNRRFFVTTMFISFRKEKSEAMRVDRSRRFKTTPNGGEWKGHA